MRRSFLAALVFTAVLAIPGLAAASPNAPAPAASVPAAPHVVRPADGPGSNVVPREHLHLSRAMDLVGWVDVQGDAGGRAQAVEKLRRQAIAMGADGVANVRFHPGSNGVASRYTASAVTFKKLHAHATPPAPAVPSAQARH